MKRLLIVDNNIDPPHGCAEIRALLEAAGRDFGSVTVQSLRGPDLALPVSPSGWDGVVLSGSKTRISESAPWIDREMEFLRALRAGRIPTLGICYGEQLMARVFGGDDSAGASRLDEFGWAEVEMLPQAGKSAVFGSLPSRFHTFQFHADEVYRVPQGAALMARSERCEVQAFEFKDAPMWGVQFHAERSLEEGNAGLDRRRARLPDAQILHRDLGAQVYDPQIAERMFRGFLSVVWGRA
ncbi:MAG: type 1 glutamine amidotransferase [Bdellovibrionales bacterium]|nr:type 1 glutamine amidotransferase [Bdellovibrionales bacterium]